MNPCRRAWLARITGAAATAGMAGMAGVSGMVALAGARAQAPSGRDEAVRRGRVLVFPRDHGAHPATRTEWWYATGWLAAPGEEQPRCGFQITFFRSRTGLAEGSRSRFAARQLLFAHAALTDLRAARHWHAQRIARWDGDAGSRPDYAAVEDLQVQLGRWRLWREIAGGVSHWQAQLRADRFTLSTTLQATQPVLLQGDAGFSRKGPEERQASHYYSVPHLAAAADIEGLQGPRTPLAGRAWLDHEWSEELLHPQAVGWDWIGMNLFDGSALMAFQLRRADGQALWAGGSWRPASGAARIFAAAELRWRGTRTWRSPATQASYPVQWEVISPAGRHSVRALLDAQELDSRGSTGAIYWEGLAELLDEQGRRVGLGYLEMTGYAAPLKLG